jgi:hypothetical protein
MPKGHVTSLIRSDGVFEFLLAIGRIDSEVLFSEMSDSSYYIVPDLDALG